MEWLITEGAYKWSEHPDFVCEDGVNNEQNVHAHLYTCQTIELDVNYSTAQNVILASIFWKEYPKHPTVQT